MSIAFFLSTKQRGWPSAAAPRNYEFKIKSKGGAIFSMFLWPLPWFRGTTQSIASMVDITERVKAEKALRDSEEKIPTTCRKHERRTGHSGPPWHHHLCQRQDLQYPPASARTDRRRPSRDFISKRDPRSLDTEHREQGCAESYEMTWIG